MNTTRYHVGDLVRTRKEHPCGADVWEVLRVGMDFRVKCLGCGHLMMMPRPQFERYVKELLPPGTVPEIKLRPRQKARPRATAPRPGARPARPAGAGAAERPEGRAAVPRAARPKIRPRPHPGSQPGPTPGSRPNPAPDDHGGPLS